VKVDDRHVEWLRALIAGRQEDARHLTDELFASGAAEPIYPLLHYTFAFAIREALRGKPTYGDVIRVVAALRAQISRTPVMVDPVAAESEILRALGDSAVPLFPDGDQRAMAQTALLCYVVRDMGLDDSQIDELLRQAGQAVTDSQPERTGASDVADDRM
jgi:hypothetical protein